MVADVVVDDVVVDDEAVEAVSATVEEDIDATAATVGSNATPVPTSAEGVAMATDDVPISAEDDALAVDTQDVPVSIEGQLRPSLWRPWEPGESQGIATAVVGTDPGEAARAELAPNVVNKVGHTVPTNDSAIPSTVAVVSEAVAVKVEDTCAATEVVDSAVPAAPVAEANYAAIDGDRDVLYIETVDKVTTEMVVPVPLAPTLIHEEDVAADLVAQAVPVSLDVDVIKGMVVQATHVSTDGLLKPWEPAPAKDVSADIATVDIAINVVEKMDPI